MPQSLNQGERANRVRTPLSKGATQSCSFVRERRSSEMSELSGLPEASDMKFATTRGRKVYGAWPKSKRKKGTKMNVS